MATVSSDATRPGLCCLPPEIFDKIASCLENPALKALRLVKTNHDPIVVNYLFHTIALSRLNSDRTAFLNVSKVPHLARAVRTLAWYDLLNRSDCTCVRPEAEASMDPLEVALSRQFEQQSDRLLWYGKLPYSFGGPWNYPAELDGDLSWHVFKESLHKAIYRLNNLTAIVVAPMHPARQIGSSAGNEYQLTVNLLDDRIGDPTVHVAQDGRFFMTYIHALMEWNSEFSNKVTTLHYCGFRSEEGFEASSFDNLTHLHLCLHDPSYRFGPFRYDGSARNLTSLTLNLSAMLTCWEENLIDYLLDEVLEPSNDETASATESGVTQRFPVLRDLNFISFHVTSNFLARFVAAHVLTVRSLRFECCYITNQHIDALACVPGLKLDSFEVETFPDPDNLFRTEAELLSLVNENPTATPDNFLESLEILESIDRTEEEEFQEIVTTHTRSDLDEEEYKEFQSREVGIPSAWLETPDDPPCWNWAFHNAKGNIWYWQTDEEESKCETTIWRCQRKDDVTGDMETQLLADDPLEFWEDWEENDERVDSIEATPFGPGFSDFVSRFMEGGLLDDEKVGELPENARMLTKEDLKEMVACEDMWM